MKEAALFWEQLAIVLFVEYKQIYFMLFYVLNKLYCKDQFFSVLIHFQEKIHIFEGSEISNKLKYMV